MLGNATNLTNTTACLGVWRGFWKFLSDYWQELSALAAIITIILVVIGLFFRRYLQKKQHEHDIKMLKLQQEQPKEEAKGILKRRLEQFISCWTGVKEKEKRIKRKYIHLDFQNDLLVCGNTLKSAIEKEERLLPETIVDEANNIVDTFIDLANSLGWRISGTWAASDAQKQQKYQEVLEEGDRIVKKTKALIEELEGGKG